jgi:hypothetical protein|tara:strand:+ start:93 stop:425 length:333 start_codon:yes stop_codon:yes gene_type:complete
MASLYAKVKKYLESNSKTWEAEENNIRLQNDGIGEDYIKTWSVDGLTKPTDEQLNAFESEATKLENNNQVVATRKSLYGTPEEQLEILVEQGVDKLIERNTKIKTDNPKE